MRKCLFLIAIMLPLAGCNISVSDKLLPVHNWSSAIVRGDYSAALSIMLVDDPDEWQLILQDLVNEHGPAYSYEQTSSARDANNVIRVRFTWRDGFSRCIRVEITDEKLIKPLDQTFQPCPENFLTGE